MPTRRETLYKLKLDMIYRGLPRAKAEERFAAAPPETVNTGVLPPSSPASAINK
jgi:hypothetical protein